MTTDSAPPATLHKTLVEELPTIASWVRNEEECYLWTSSRIPFPIDLDTLAEDIRFGAWPSWTVRMKRQPVAFGQIIPMDDGRLHLARLIVAPDVRGRGLGRLLATALRDKALAQKPRAVSLRVYADNLPALALYQSLGFIEAEAPPGEPAPTALYLEQGRR